MEPKFDPRRPCAEAGAHDPVTGALIGKWLVQDGRRYDIKTHLPLDAPPANVPDPDAARNAELAKAFSGGEGKPPRKVTPAATALAKNFGVNVDDIALGSGKDGAVTMDDVKAYIEAQKSAPPATEGGAEGGAESGNPGSEE